MCWIRPRVTLDLMEVTNEKRIDVGDVHVEPILLNLPEGSYGECEA